MGGFKAGEKPFPDEGDKSRRIARARWERLLLIRRFDDEEIADIGRADVATQLLVERLLRRRKRAHARQLVLPIGVMMKGERETGGDESNAENEHARNAAMAHQREQ